MIISALAWALTEEEKQIAANLDFFTEYEIIERDDFQEIYVDSTNEENNEGESNNDKPRMKKK